MLLELDDSLVQDLSPEEIRQILALDLYKRDKLTKAQARRMTNLSRLEFEQLLMERGVGQEYGEDEFRQDQETLKALNLL
jgi:predicted HTH domain antitoxin